jgi:hypothetical protein
MWGADNSPITAIKPEDSYTTYDKRPVRQFQNGRVIGLQGTRGDQFQMFTENNNRSNNAKDTILYGTLTRSPLSDAFFSDRNMENIQNMLRYRVFVNSRGKYKIGRQDNTELQVIMRAIYLQFAKHLPYEISGQINKLNRQVIDFCLPKVMSEVQQYLHYIQQLETMPSQIPLPINVSSAGTRTLKSVTTTF